MRRFWLTIGMVAVLLLGLAVPVMRSAQAQNAAQDASFLVVWYTVDDVGPVIEQVSAAFEESFGATVDVQFVRPQQLYDLMAKTGGADVILASSDDIGPLVDNGLVVDRGSSSTFFLGDVLDALPDLLNDVCGGSADVAGCLWPRVSPTLPVTVPDARLMARTESWLCSSADWMPMCAKGDLPGEPVSWWFNLYLISDAWLAENGFVVPVDVTGIDELRSEFGLDYTWAQEGSLPLADSADASTVYIFPSSLLVDDPQGYMRSLGSFDQEGYLPVLELGIDGLFISADSGDPALAQRYVEFFAADAGINVELMAEAKHLPVLTEAEMRAFGLDTAGSVAVLRATAILTAYTQLVF